MKHKADKSIAFCFYNGITLLPNVAVTVVFMLLV